MKIEFDLESNSCNRDLYDITKWYHKEICENNLYIAWKRRGFKKYMNNDYCDSYKYNTEYKFEIELSCDEMLRIELMKKEEE